MTYKFRFMIVVERQLAYPENGWLNEIDPLYMLHVQKAAFDQVGSVARDYGRAYVLDFERQQTHRFECSTYNA